MAAVWTETDIAALLDGELEGEARARMARIVETDAEARACADRIRKADALLREAFAAPMAEPIPKSIAEALESGNVVAAFRPRRAPSRARAWGPAALAASVALLVGVGTGAFLSPLRDGPPAGGALSALSVGHAPEGVAAALETSPSGVARGGVRPLSSFRVAEGGVCREFEVTAPSSGPAAFGLACRDDGAWRVLYAADVGGGDAAGDDGFAPASGAAVDAAVALLDALGAGPALDPSAEAGAIDGGWR